jgi:hypothetical protein
VPISVRLRWAAAMIISRWVVLKLSGKQIKPPPGSTASRAIASSMAGVVVHWSERHGHSEVRGSAWGEGCGIRVENRGEPRDTRCDFLEQFELLAVRDAKLFTADL